MAECIKVRIKHRSLCAGDLDRKITIMNRTLETTEDATTDSVNKFKKEKDVWAALRTTKGKDMFFATNLDIGVTHVFYTRHFEWLTSRQWICYGGKKYDIVEVENLDERSEWSASFCNIRGEGTQRMNDA